MGTETRTVVLNKIQIYNNVIYVQSWLPNVDKKKCTNIETSDLHLRLLEIFKKKKQKKSSWENLYFANMSNIYVTMN